MEQREKLIRLWFDMWLKQDITPIDTIFSEYAVYIESWGPIYRGLDWIKHWFREWNFRGTVIVWYITRFIHQGRFTVVEWHFESELNDGSEENFDGVSLVEWDDSGKICSLKEFGSKLPHYNPYD